MAGEEREEGVWTRGAVDDPKGLGPLGWDSDKGEAGSPARFAMGMGMDGCPALAGNQDEDVPAAVPRRIDWRIVLNAAGVHPAKIEVRGKGPGAASRPQEAGAIGDVRAKTLGGKRKEEGAEEERTLSYATWGWLSLVQSRDSRAHNCCTTRCGATEGRR